MKARWWIPVVLVWAPAAIADTVKLLPATLEMPDRIGPLAYTGKPDIWPDKRLGVSYKYVAPGMILDIYAYDAGLTDIPEGAVSRPVCEQFEQAKLDIGRGGYKDVVLKGEQLARMSATQEPPLAREAVFEAIIMEAPSISYLWITGADGNFIKVRFSINAQLRYEVEDARRAILNAVGDAIRPRLRPAATPGPAAENPGANQGQQAGSVSLSLGSGSVADMGFALKYLTGLSVQAVRYPESVPPCGGLVRPGFEAELAAYKLALSSRKPGPTFANLLGEIDSAGFLEEFLWTAGHRDYWGDTPPANLDLKAYKKWSRKKVKGQKFPQFGQVELKQVRQLPIEPL